MNKGAVTAPAMAGVILITVFAILCLSVFSTLVLSSQGAAGRLSDADARAVGDYYAADRAAEETLSALRRGERPAGVAENDGVCDYSVKIDDTRTLCVSVELDGADYKILRWETVSASGEYDDSLPVWTGAD